MGILLSFFLTSVYFLDASDVLQGIKIDSQLSSLLETLAIISPQQADEHLISAISMQQANPVFGMNYFKGKRMEREGNTKSNLMKEYCLLMVDGIRA